MEKICYNAMCIFSFFSGGKICFPTWEFVEIFPTYFPNLLINLRPLVAALEGEHPPNHWHTPPLLQPKRLGRIDSFFLAEDPSSECFQGHRGDF